MFGNSSAATQASMDEMRNYCIRGTFRQWLSWRVTQPNTSDDLRGFAEWIAQDSRKTCWPLRAKTLDYLTLHLRVHHHDDPDAPTIERLASVCAMYYAFIRSGGVIPKKIDYKRTGKDRGLRQHPSDSTQRGYLVKRSTIAKIKEIAVRTDRAQGAVVDDMANALYRKLFAAE